MLGDERITRLRPGWLEMYMQPMVECSENRILGMAAVSYMKVRDVIKRLEADGWCLVATKGSHRQYEHLTKKGRVTVPGHFGDDMPIGTLYSVLRQAGLKR